MTRGKLRVEEWYFPTGQLQKRYVSDKTGYAVEPVRVWHENGQLAEELHTKKGEELGPWLKFFDDGSPRLEAEHRKGRTWSSRTPGTTNGGRR
jgi:antitoxin component YwqK of YwqJK toxin-antitoxin module